MTGTDARWRCLL